MDLDRTGRIAEAMERGGYRALICRMPQHVVMLTSYQPILGNLFCVVSLTPANELEVRLAIPTDEADRVPAGLAVETKTFAEETMEYIGDTISAVRQPLSELLRAAGLTGRVKIGHEGGHSPIATGYTQVGIPGAATMNMLRDLLPEAELNDATDLLDELSAIKTERDLAGIFAAEDVAAQGFRAAREAVRVGATEADVAAATVAAMLQAGYAVPGALHVLPYVHVMAGARAADAYKAYNLTGNATIQRGDTVSVQMEVAINGYWAELTRAFFAEEISDTWRNAQSACVAAQDAALKVIRAGTSGHDADAAAREVMERAGFGKEFKHGLGHGFGFQAINHAAQPVLHPASKSILADGMVHNMEPAVYLEGVGGFRLNDNVLVREGGAEVLSAALPRDLEWLVVQ